jgi:peptidoglycan/xylan/chitin deacetylase (PgdA/CDA1 family)
LVTLKKILVYFFSFKQLELFREIVCHIIFYSGFGWLISKIKKKGGTILVYHSIGGKNIFPASVTPTKKFKKQLSYLNKKYIIVKLEVIVKRIERGQKIPSNWVVITFDDGYKDIVFTAAQLLKNINAPFSVFITKNLVDNRQSLFVDELYNALMKTKENIIEINDHDKKMSYDISSIQKRKEICLRIAIQIRQWPRHKIQDFTNRIKKACKINFNKSANHLSLEQIRELAAFSEIGSHAQSHINLMILSDSDQDKEIINSKNYLTEITNKNVTAFAYPFGKNWAFNQKLKQKLRKNGYKCGLTTLPGKVDENSDIFQLPRFGAGNSLVRLKLNLMGINI